MLSNPRHSFVKYLENIKTLKCIYEERSRSKEACDWVEATGCSDATLRTLDQRTVDDIRVYAHNDNRSSFSFSYTALFLLHIIYIYACVSMWIRLSVNLPNVSKYIYLVFLVTTSNDKFNVNEQPLYVTNNFSDSVQSIWHISTINMELYGMKW